MIIAGIDPGIRFSGYAFIEDNRGQLKLLDIGVLQLCPSSETPSVGERLERISDHFEALFKKWNPALIGLERVVTAKNVASSLKLAEARGVLRLAAHRCLEDAEDRLVEISPTAVKKNASGLGGAKKQGVSQAMLLRFFAESDFLKAQSFRHDALDALAIAWTARVLRQRSNLGLGGKSAIKYRT